MQHTSLITDPNPSDLKMDETRQRMVEDVGSTDHRITDLFRQEKTLQIIQSNSKQDLAQTSQYHSTISGHRGTFPGLRGRGEGNG